MSLSALASLLAVFQPAPCGLDQVEISNQQVTHIECGWVTVQAQDGDERTIRLWTARVSAIDPRQQADPILYINGGPGIATVDSVLPALATSKTLIALLQHRDLILFDQRGSGRSEESLCPDLAGKLNAIESEGLDPLTEDDRSRAAFAGCRAELGYAGIDLEAYTTDATVADIETLRDAFGVEKWNLLSVSYGSLVAMRSMRTHPETIRSVVLNSPYPPNSVTWAEQASSAAAAYSAIDRACASQPECRARFGELVPKLEATLARLEREPLQDGENLITGRRFASALWPLAVGSSTNRFVPQAIARAHAGDAELITKMVRAFAAGDSFGDFAPAQAFAISCHESGRTREWYGRARALYPALVSGAPDDSWDRLCATFRPGFADAGFFAPVASDIPTLIYSGSLDPATPVVDAYQAMRFLTHGTLIEVPDAAHAPIGIDECTRNIAVAFMDRPEAPPDLTCLAGRDRMKFALDGLDELLEPSNP